MSLLFLVVSNNDDVDVQKLSEVDCNGIVLVVATRNPYGNLKRTLKQYCNDHFIKFRMAFVIPPVDNVNDELLTGYGKLYDQEVMLYGHLQAFGTCDREEDGDETDCRGLY